MKKDYNLTSIRATSPKISKKGHDMQRKTQIEDEFSTEDRERKITLQAGDAAPEFSLQTPTERASR